jgi:hypothetical protein
MGLITLDVPLAIKIQEGGKTIKELKITYRYPTKQEEKEFDTFTKNMQTLAKKLSKLDRERKILGKKQEYAEKAGDFIKAEKLLDKLEKLENEAEKLVGEFEKNGGENFQEVISEKIFNTLVGGEDKEKLREIAERVTYTRVIDLLTKERSEYEKKQSGE